MRHLQDLSVLVLGLGESGLAMARWCARHGAAVQVWDSRETPPQAAALQADVPQARLFSGELGSGQLAGVQMLLKSPGLSPLDVRVAPLLEAARGIGLAIGGELDLFARALADLKAERGYAPKLLAITGTNGKTTTTAMTALLVERTGRRVGVAGNIGPTTLDTLAAALDKEPVPVEPVAEEVDDEAAVAATPVETIEPAGLAEPVEPVESIEPAEPLALTEAAESAEPAEASEPADVPEPAEAAPPPDEEAPLQLAPPPPAAPVFEHLPDVWVLELSSFQLDGVKGFEPSAATVLNVTQDHLDWHGSMEAYAAAKARVFGAQTVLVINRDDVRVEAMIPAPEIIKGARGRPAKQIHRKALRFGLDAPQRPGDFGLVIENGMAWLVRALEADETIKRRKGEDEEIHLQRLMPADALRVRGRHNAANALAALALATAIGCPLAPMLHGLREYRGEPHRVEFIASVGGVEAFDDSKGTNVGATVAALEGLGADKAPGKLVVILGGDGKGQDFTPLAAPVTRYARAVALIGRDAGAIATALAGTGVTMQTHGTLPEAVAWCFAQAQPSDAVLLSPACASLDMFRNYAHRAEVFVQAVHAHAADHGETLA
ncbi:UDP-N-acetylmuramoyl-L-alanine--D-glutamate ligase [Aquabacterium sp.]|uniref:UDP-N-acetylmuramoyl-L-alanine--D-glutamate ligase n=1 Tax=Aquabacterium sp. TaxID=1872578 RepID=UPI002C734A75|nr:UDP-N-acetylmuramoyl-L-alanine--D-glutamate ligase [Aquabacterium sp.]HSW04311.1 UDP-N-acetylmuramoyl-L-alanine--D-glutamate ligase [Aquabacterium sp.]